MSIVLVLVAFALLMAIPAFLALGAVITAGGASLPGAPAPSDFGRDAVTVLGLSGGLYLLGVATLVRVESRLLALGALGVAVVILGIALWDWLDAVERVGGALSGLAVVALGGLVAGVGAVARIVLGHADRRR